jgi:ATP-binding cassette subfamily B protein
MSATMLVLAPMTVIGGVVMALRQDAGLAWLLAVSLPFLVVCLGLVVRQMVPQFRLMQERIDRINGVLREQIVGMRVVRAFVREPEETERFRGVNDQLTATSLVAGRLMALMFPMMLLVINGSSVAVIWFGAERVGRGEMTIGSLVAFLTYFSLILVAVMMATFVALIVPRAAVCAERIGEVLATDSTVRAPANPVTELAARGSLELREVGFHYPGAEHAVLADISFRSLAGQTTAIIGSTGSGKTSLINLVARLFDVTAGQVLLDGVGPSPATSATAGPRRPTRRCGRRSRWPRRPTSCGPCRKGSRRWSPRAAATSRAGSASGSRSPGPSCASPRSTCSTTRSRRSTSPPTRACERR